MNKHWQLTRDLWEISRPRVYLSSLVPFYLGYVLASGGFMGPWAGLIGVVIWGPLVWLAVLAINDAHDLGGDLLNPRKNTPLTVGRLSAGGVKTAAYGAAALAIALSFTVRPGMVIAVFGFLACGWIYSVPPAKWKNRPGLDIISNCGALAMFPALGGWAAVKPLDGFPWVVTLVLLLIHIALYTPTVIADIESDRASGYTTSAVRFGAEQLYRLGLLCWAAFWALTTIMFAVGEFVPTWMVWVQVTCAPIFIWIYHISLRKAREPRDIRTGMMRVVRLFMLPSLIFLLAYTGMLSL